MSTQSTLKVLNYLILLRIKLNDPPTVTLYDRGQNHRQGTMSEMGCNKIDKQRQTILTHVQSSLLKLARAAALQSARVNGHYIRSFSCDEQL